MDRHCPSPVEGLCHGEARIVEPALVEQGGGAIRPTRPRQRGHVVEHPPEGVVRVGCPSIGVTLFHSAFLSAHVC
jgi:hypothetical protein